ncbi:NADH dehydrogenase [ubiquinone] 1 alpha subcomplex subunit 7-like [Ylistrum balloti]|uniref:NADH dehydrogenase [ubiquinone] 1 alpha subcomplex subunit 7-like n=1 Tax=Ylistrum balloti TaxID=509963 RepID=UPI002905AAD2|nr:NADH dehydrogenase [ubiquinone] 1 alpha subcomplex subunit 7-like [Ylistrum balloti]
MQREATCYKFVFGGAKEGLFGRALRKKAVSMSAVKKMAVDTVNRTPSSIIGWIRTTLTRNIIYKDANRYPNSESSREQPPPNLPDGPSALLSDNYYYTRDARCLVEPAEALYTATPKYQTLAAGNETEKASSDTGSVAQKKRLGPTPPGFRPQAEMTPKTFNPKLV